MFGALKNTARSLFTFLGRLPLVNKVVGTKDTRPDREEVRSFHKEAPEQAWQSSNPNIRSDTSLTKNIASDDWSTNPRWGNSVDSNFEISEQEVLIRNSLRKILSTRSQPLCEGRDKLEKSINQIERLQKNSPDAVIQFNTTHIVPEAQAAMQELNRSFLQKLNTLKYDSENPRSTEAFVELYTEQIHKAFQLASEINDKILSHVVGLDDYITDINLAEALETCRAVTMAVAAEALSGLEQSEGSLPGVKISGQIDFGDYIKIELADEIKSLFLASRFGIQDKLIFDEFCKVNQEIDTSSDYNCHRSCSIATLIQKASYGALLYDYENTNLREPELAQIDPDLFNRAFNTLLNTSLDEFRLRHDDIDDSEQSSEFNKLEDCKIEIAKMLTNCSDIEVETQRKVKEELSKEVFWDSMGLDSGLHNSIDRYAQLNRIDETLGTVNEEQILGRTYAAHSVIESLRVEGLEANNMREHFDRLLHETSLVALIDVLSTHRGVKPEDQYYMLHDNFETIPWLKDFYLERIAEYKSWIEPKSVTDLPIRRLAKELSHLGEELYGISSSSHPLFEFADLCAAHRYNITDSANQMLKRIAKMTDIGKLSLHLELASNLLANLEPGQEHGLDDDEVKQIRDIIQFMKDETMLRDKETGKQVIAPITDGEGRTELGMERTKHMREIIGSRGYLMMNTPVIIKFLKNSLEADNQKPQLGDGQSIEHRNSILASLLFYVVLKFLPEANQDFKQFWETNDPNIPSADDIDSLRKRAEIYKTLMFIISKGQRYVPILFNKMLQQGLGLQNDLKTPHMDDKHGVFISLKEDLEQQLLAYSNQEPGKEKNRLRPLLDLYVDIDQFNKDNAQVIAEVEQNLKQNKDFKGPLFLGIEKIIDAVIESDTATVVEFVKDQRDPALSRYTQKLLIKQAGKIANELLESNLDKYGNLSLKDFDQTSLTNFADLAIYCKQAAYLMNQQGSAWIQIRSMKDEPEYNDAINKLGQIFGRGVTLITNNENREIEDFVGQSTLKTTCIELLKEEEFKFRPSIGNRFEWHDQSTIEAKLEAAQEAKYVLTNRAA